MDELVRLGIACIFAAGVIVLLVYITFDPRTRKLK